MSIRLWDRAAGLPVRVGDRARPEIVALQIELPTVEELFGYMRDAERRFDTLRMRIQERIVATRGEQLNQIEVMLRHPGFARVTETEPALGTSGNYELWLSDGTTVRTYSGFHRIGTKRPARRIVSGLDNPDLPGMSTVYRPVTALPRETLPDVFIHPAGFCQNVLATGTCWIAGATEQAGREAIVVECDHPRAIEVWADRPQHHFQVTVDRETGVITRLVEMMGDLVTRDAEVTTLEPDGPLPPSAFDFTFPSDATMLF